MNSIGAQMLRGETVETMLKQGPIRGHILRSEPGGKVTLVPWYKAARVPISGSSGPETWNPRVFLQNIRVPDHIHQQMVDGLPPERQRTPRERYRVLVTRLVHDAMKSKERFGRVIWPKSIEDEIKVLAWKEADPTLLDRIEMGALDAIEKYAGLLMEKARHQQKEKDRKKVTLDWHGHYN